MIIDHQERILQVIESVTLEYKNNINEQGVIQYLVLADQKIRSLSESRHQVTQLQMALHTAVAGGIAVAIFAEASDKEKIIFIVVALCSLGVGLAIHWFMQVQRLGEMLGWWYARIRKIEIRSCPGKIEY